MDLPADVLRRLQQITAALSRAVTEEDVVTVAVEDARSLTRAGAAFFGLVDDEKRAVVLTGARGLSGELLSVFASVSLDAPTGLATIIRDGTPMLIQRRVFQERFPHIAPMWERAGYASGVGVPLVVGGRRLGAFGMLFANERAFSVEDQHFMLTLGELIGQALQRARLYAEMHAAEDRSRRDAERLRRLSDVSAALARVTDDHDAVLEVIARISSEVLGDPSVLRLVADDGVTLRIAATASTDPAVRLQQLLLMKLDAQSPQTIHDSGVGAVVRDGKPVLRNGLVGAELVPSAQLPALEQRPLRAMLAVPLRASTGVLGVLTTARFDDVRPYVEADLSFLQEIADRAAIAVEKARLYREARAAIAVRDDFLSVAGHELRTPLTAALLQLTTLERLTARAGANPGVDPARLVVLRRQLTRLQRLVDQLLDVSRITGGRLSLDREPLDLVELAREVIERCTADSGASQPPVSLDAPGPVRGEWDRVALDSVVTNLVSNALRYGAGKPVEVRVRADGADAVLEVRDHGIGIAPSEHERIFRKFERAVETRSYAGFGLGLWICRQIVELHGGVIGVESTPGEGARMVTRLPLSARA